MARQGAIGLENFIRNRIARTRYWKLTSLGKKRPKWGFEFTVMTYNILSQAAVEGHMYLYMKCNPQFLSEEYRISKILPEILNSKSDVVCLQEVEQWIYEQRIKQVFDSNGFGSVFKKRTGNKSDGCAILWRRAKFNLLRHQGVEFRAKGCELLNRDNVGLIAVLKPKHPQENQTQLHVATSHLIFNPRRGDVKLCQIRLLLAELERSAFRSVGANGRVYHPTILCGDFNFEPHSPLYNFVENGRLDVAGLVAGNMSGQHDGKDKGGTIFGNRLSMDKIGIDDSGRFGQDSDKGAPGLQASNSCNDSVFNSSSGADLSHKEAGPSNGSKLEAYRVLKKMDASVMQPTIVVDSFGNDQGSNYTKNDFLKESSPSSSGSDGEIPQLFYHDFNFVPTYKYYHHDSKSCPITSMTGRDFNTVDHIFYNVKHKSSTSFVEDRLKLLGIYKLPLAEDLKDLGGLPNAHLGSDHLCLMAKFIISFKY